MAFDPFNANSPATDQMRRRFGTRLPAEQFNRAPAGTAPTHWTGAASSRAIPTEAAMLRDAERTVAAQHTPRTVDYRAGNKFVQTPQPFNAPDPRRAAMAAAGGTPPPIPPAQGAAPASGGFWRKSAGAAQDYAKSAVTGGAPGTPTWKRALNTSGKTAGVLGALAYEGSEVFDEAQRTGNAPRALARGGIRAAGTIGGSAIGGSVGGLAAGALGIESGPGAVVTGLVGKAVGGATGAVAGNKGASWLVDRYLPAEDSQSNKFADVSTSVDSSERTLGARRRGSANMAASLDGTRGVRGTMDYRGGMQSSKDYGNPSDEQQAFDAKRLSDSVAEQRALALPERVAAMNNDAPNINLRGRQGGIIANPHAMSSVDRIRALANDPSLKGSPSLRKLAAEQIMQEAQNVEDNFQGAQQENATADFDQTKMRSDATENFARRRVDVDLFNSEMSEKRRGGDLDRQVTREGNVLDAAARAAGERGRGISAAKTPEAFQDKLYEDYLEQTDDPGLAMQLASRAATNAGVDNTGSPVSNYGQTVEEDAISGGRKEYGQTWFGKNPAQFDQANALPEQQGFFERNNARFFPGGRDENSVKWKDPDGNVDWTSPNAIPVGETVESYRQRRERMQKLRNLPKE